ncbi:hypothetical protein [Saccharothrix obliqua]|uniref:hypothetical protein n=1 Tax=Saccharothrix obliqua TaxID=2861747 RepID=UPI001C5FAF9A|nr:hypothetical protein [Saccharothrix obliqua]MBW4717600.1 hypothetical protein [Saccharothrix obliqua]
MKVDSVVAAESPRLSLPRSLSTTTPAAPDPVGDSPNPPTMADSYRASWPRTWRVDGEALQEAVRESSFANRWSRERQRPAG